MGHDSDLFLFAGGGTGGHLFPGIAVAQALGLRDPNVRCGFVGSRRALETKVLREHGFEQFSLPAEPLNRLFRSPAAFLWNNWRAYQIAKGLIRQHQPKVVIGLGGYASAPLVLAANRRHIPIVLLEQNSIPGRTTRWLSRWATVICLSYHESERYFPQHARTRLTGNPVRQEIASLGGRVRIEADPPTILILGGSQGSQPLNRAMVELYEKVTMDLPGWRIIHQTGVADYELVRTACALRGNAASVEVVPFIEDMARQLACASLVVSRAGATTLAELACAGLPSILVPYPQAADQHQWHNAEAFRRSGAACLVPQTDDPSRFRDNLWQELLRVCNDRSIRLEMANHARKLARPEAVASIVEIIDSILVRPGRN